LLEPAGAVSTEDEVRSPRHLPLLERIDGTRVPIEPHARLRDVGEGESRKLEPDLGGRRGPLVAGIRDDEHEELVERQLANGRSGQSDVPVVRRIEDASKDPGYCHSRSSSPTSTCVPRLMPSARSASSSSPAGGGVPTTR